MSFSPHPLPPQLNINTSSRQRRSVRSQRVPKNSFIDQKTPRNFRKPLIICEKDEEIRYPKPPLTAPAGSGRFRRLLTEKERFLNDIDGYLDEQFSFELSEVDRLHVYKKCFGFLCGEFVLCRPLLERIKKEYDYVADMLIKKKQEMLVGSELVYAADDSYNSTITEIRNIKNKEFKALKEETDRKLDILTELRLRRSKLMKSRETLEKQNFGFKESIRTGNDMIADLVTKINYLKQDSKIIRAEAREHSLNTAKFEDELSKTTMGVDELQSNKDKITNQINNLNQRKEELINRIEQLKTENTEGKDKLAKLKSEIAELEKVKENKDEKLKSASEKDSNIEEKMRKLLRNVGIENDEAQLEDLFKQLIRAEPEQEEEEEEEENAETEKETQ